MPDEIEIFTVVEVDRSDGQIFSVKSFLLRADAERHAKKLNAENIGSDNYDTEVRESTVS